MLDLHCLSAPTAMFIFRLRRRQLSRPFFLRCTWTHHDITVSAHVLCRTDRCGCQSLRRGPERNMKSFWVCRTQALTDGRGEQQRYIYGDKDTKTLQRRYFQYKLSLCRHLPFLTQACSHNYIYSGCRNCAPRGKKNDRWGQILRCHMRELSSNTLYSASRQQGYKL